MIQTFIWGILLACILYAFFFVSISVEVYSLKFNITNIIIILSIYFFSQLNSNNQKQTLKFVQL